MLQTVQGTPLKSADQQGRDVNTRSPRVETGFGAWQRERAAGRNPSKLSEQPFQEVCLSKRGEELAYLPRERVGLLAASHRLQTFGPVARRRGDGHGGRRARKTAPGRSILRAGKQTLAEPRSTFRLLDHAPPARWRGASRRESGTRARARSISQRAELKRLRERLAYATSPEGGGEIRAGPPHVTSRHPGEDRGRRRRPAFFSFRSLGIAVVRLDRLDRDARRWAGRAIFGPSVRPETKSRNV